MFKVVCELGIGKDGIITTWADVKVGTVLKSIPINIFIGVLRPWARRERLAKGECRWLSVFPAAVIT